MSAPAAALALLSILIVTGGRAYHLTNGTLAAGAPSFVTEDHLQLVGLNLSTGNASATVYVEGQFVVLLVSQGNVSLRLLNASFTPSPVGGYAASLELWTNSSSASLVGLWQGAQPEQELPGLEAAILSEGPAPGGSYIMLQGASPLFEEMTSFSPTSWVNFVLGGDRWVANVVVGIVAQSSSTTTSQQPTLPPLTVTPSGAPRAAVLTRGSALGLLTILVSALSLVLAAVAERGSGGGAKGA